jgi:hypothetical protein
MINMINQGHQHLLMGLHLLGDFILGIHLGHLGNHLEHHLGHHQQLDRFSS